MTLANNAYGSILGTVGASATTVTIKNSRGGLFPNTFPYRLTLEQLNSSDVVTKREIVEVSNRVGDTFTVSRGAEDCPPSDTATTQGTTQYEFIDGDLLQLRLTSERITDIESDISSNYTTLDTNKLNVTTYNAERSLYLSSSTGTDAYAITDATVASYVDGKTYKIGADVANTGAATLQLNALGAIALKKMSNRAFEALVTGDIIANQIFWATYNSAESCFQFSVDPATAAVVTLPYKTNKFTTATTWSADTGIVGTKESEIYVDTTELDAGQVKITIDSTDDYYVFPNEKRRLFLEASTSISLDTEDDVFLTGTSTETDSKTITDYTGTEEGIFFKPDGTKMYLLVDDSSNNNIMVYQYSLSTAWDLSTLSYDSISVNLYSGVSSRLNDVPGQLFFSDDGSTLFVTGQDPANTYRIFQYDVPTPWVLTGITSTPSYAFAPGFTTFYSFCFSDNGKYLFAIDDDGSGYVIKSYALRTPFSLVDLHLSNLIAEKSLSNSSEARGVIFHKSGKRFFVCEGNGALSYVFTYECAIPWDISTAYQKRDATTLPTGDYERGIGLSPDGKIFLVERTTPKITELTGTSETYSGTVLASVNYEQ